MVDYYLVRKGRVNLPELYTESRAGAYHYARGVNPRAIAAFVPAAIISTLLALLPAFAELSPFSWFFGAGLAGLIHYALAKRRTATAKFPAKRSRWTACSIDGYLAGLGATPV